MTLAVQSAHQAYRAASELGAPPAAAQNLTWRYVARTLNEPLDIRTDHLIAAGGALFFLVAGAACGAWLAG